MARVTTQLVKRDIFRSIFQFCLSRAQYSQHFLVVLDEVMSEKCFKMESKLDHDPT